MFSAARSGSDGPGRVAGQRLGIAVRPDLSKAARERLLVGAHRRLDRDLDQLGAEVGGDRPRVVLGLGAGVGGGHDDAADVLGAERVGGEQRDQGRVDPAREGDADVPEAVLADVVAEAEDQRPVDLGAVLERLAELRRPRGRDVAEQELLLELGGAGDDLAVGVDDEAVAVEDELVLAADEVAEREMGAVGARPFGEHRFPLAALAAVVGGAGGVGDQPRPLVGLDRGRRALDPDVLADRQPDPVPATSIVIGSSTRSEIALLVEDRVVRQPPLAVDLAHLAVGEHRQRVVGLPVAVAARPRPARRTRPGRRSRSPPRRAPARRGCRPRRSGASGRGPRPGSRGSRARER